jgi:hypothetical protein
MARPAETVTVECGAPVAATMSERLLKENATGARPVVRILGLPEIENLSALQGQGLPRISILGVDWLRVWPGSAGVPPAFFDVLIDSPAS